MSPRRKVHESGFALILSLLALVLLTTMGMALANSTGVELQISTNQRWSESARYNAEAGIEYGKNLLMTMPSWANLLPPARTVADWAPTAWNGAGAANETGTAPFARATRNFENWQCDEKGFGMGYGVVVDDGGAAGPEEYRSEIGGAVLNGSFTLWIRRPVMWSGGNGTGTTLQDYTDDAVLILVSEGVAPYAGAAANLSAFGAANRATYTIETLLNRTGTIIVDQSECNSSRGCQTSARAT
jgi:PilX N-terminal